MMKIGKVHSPKRSEIYRCIEKKLKLFVVVYYKILTAAGGLTRSSLVDLKSAV